MRAQRPAKVEHAVIQRPHAERLGLLCMDLIAIERKLFHLVLNDGQIIGHPRSEQLQRLSADLDPALADHLADDAGLLPLIDAPAADRLARAHQLLHRFFALIELFAFTDHDQRAAFQRVCGVCQQRIQIIAGRILCAEKGSVLHDDHFMRFKQRQRHRIFQDDLQQRCRSVIDRDLRLVHLQPGDLRDLLFDRRALLTIYDIVHVHHLSLIIANSPRAVLTYLNNAVVRMRMAPSSAVE